MGRDELVPPLSGDRNAAITACASDPPRHYFYPLKRGCSSVVEHLLAKEDVASSSLVTRSTLTQTEGGSLGALNQVRWMDTALQ